MKKNNSTSHSTQPNPWMDPTHVHLCDRSNAQPLHDQAASHGDQGQGTIRHGRHNRGRSGIASQFIRRGDGDGDDGTAASSLAASQNCRPGPPRLTRSTTASLCGLGLQLTTHLVMGSRVVARFASRLEFYIPLEISLQRLHLDTTNFCTLVGVAR